MTILLPAPKVVGMLQPAFLYGGAASRAKAIERIRARIPELEVLDAEYIESSELRTERSSPSFVRGEEETPLTTVQSDVLARVEAVIALDLPFDVAEHAPNLRWVQATGSGIGQFRSAELESAGIQLTNASGTSSLEVAEFVLARILQHIKRLPEIDANQALARWRPISGRSAESITIGIVGLGPIGLRVAELSKALRMRVLGLRRRVTLMPASVDRVYSPENLVSMVAECDVVVAALPSTAQTHGLFDRRIFDAMPANALFCNVGRGSSVVTDDLLSALRNKQLGGAVLDVFEQEPLPVGSPLWSTPGVHISSHSASVPSVAMERVANLFCDNVRRLQTGRELQNLVDLSRGF